jgi:hypothetical protein
MPIRSFRGRLGHESQATIALHTNKGDIGYRIVKFNVCPENPFAAADKELVFKVYTVEQRPTLNGVIDFSDNTLLAVGLYSDSDGSAAPVTQTTDTIIFDNSVFNQDIYVTMVDKHGTQSGNYYIELEQMPLNLNEQTVATLKDIRNIGAQ